IHKTLAVSRPSGPGDPVREGRRFAGESLLQLSHNHYVQALEAAESAVALAPAQPEHTALLARCLTTVAIYLTNPKGMRSIYAGKFLIKVEPDKLKASLRLARRGFEIRADTLDRLSPRDQKTLGIDANINILTTDTQRLYRNHLGFYDPAAFDDEAV